ncbi:MAG: mechanosensitive ion channel family protein [Candidatus Bathyarchaeota archaeon]|nr:mechanosensitive ion channel family protein [Candidatus Bathyarchaeota archaeon]
MATLPQIFQQTFQTSLSNGEIMASLVIFAVVAVVGWAAYLVVSRYVSRLTLKTETTLDDDILAAVKAFIIIMIVVLGIEYALTPLSFLNPYSATLNGVFLVIQIMMTAFAVTRVSNIIIDYSASRAVSTNGKNNNHLFFLLKKILQIVVFVFAILIILYVFNVDLSAAIVGLGVGGIAIAFALQSTLSDFFSAFSIYFDRPFEIGDFITVGDYSGTVTNIGVKSTRVKLLQGEELVISNKELTSEKVRNFRKLEKRRVTFTIGVTYATKVVKLKQIPFLIKDIIETIDRAELVRVHFTEYGDFSLKFVIVYYVNSSDYVEYLNIQQQLNLGIKEAFEREGIEMAFPTNTIYLKKE